MSININCECASTRIHMLQLVHRLLTPHSAPQKATQSHLQAQLGQVTSFVLGFIYTNVYANACFCGPLGWGTTCSAVHMQDEILANGIPSDNPAFIRLQNFLFWYVCWPGQMEFSSCQQKALHFVVHSLLTLKYLRKLSSGKMITSNFNQAAALTYLRLDWASFILPHKIIRSDFRKVQLGGHAEISLQLTTKVTSS